jgi:molybdopterin molybdotransferase
LVVTSAGISRGYYDVVKEVLAEEGEIDFWTVAMKPGKPLAFGWFWRKERRVPHLGLPGNPVSALLVFELFGRPALMKMMGKKDWSRPRVRAIAEERIDTRTDDRVFLARCIVTKRDGRYYARLTGPQGSGILTSLARANGVTFIPPQKRIVEPGEEIEVIMLDWSHGEEWGTEPGFVAQQLSA